MTKEPTKALVVTEPVPTTERPSAPDAAPAKVGDWFWIHGDSDDDDEKRWLGCVTHVGSNYLNFEGVAGRWSYSDRVHFDRVPVCCTPAPDAQAIVAREIVKRRQNVMELLDEVKLLTAKLGVDPRGLPTPEGETQALAVRSGEPTTAYKKALIQAKDTDLPKLFERIRDENKIAANWMQAELIPLRAQADGLRPIVKAVENRIFNVELYAGLMESIVQIKDGAPAPTATPITLFQRRCYMDEESLITYTSGGLDFRGVESFDRWICEPANLNRLLPTPRCIVAFRVRRWTKDWGDEATSLAQWVRFADWDEYNKMTFLFMRNGDRVYVHVERSGIHGDPATVKSTMTEAEYLERIEAAKKRAAERRAKKGLMTGENADDDDFSTDYDVRDLKRDWHPWDETSVYFDDITLGMKAQMEEHNRLVLVLQGLLDRSLVFHPHPPCKLWQGRDFQSMIQLVFDDARALAPGAAPDFEAYRAKLNASIGVGSVTIGQERFWMGVEAERENNRRKNDWRLTRAERDREYERFKPYGNPGPGYLATVGALSKTKGCTYNWKRSRLRPDRWGDWTPIDCSIQVPVAELFNASAYQPGDFHRFFDDPRTRTQYLRWASFLLEAEEYKAGNRKVGTRVDD